MSVLVDGEDRILHVIEDGLQLRGGLFADLARQRLRLIRHQAHRANDAAALRIDAVVVLAHAGKQGAQIDLAIGGAGCGQLPFEQSVEAFLRGRLLA